MILTRDGKEITAIYKQDGTEVEEVKDANGRIVYYAFGEIVGDLPLSFSGKGKPLTDYLIYGNAVQDGTPTPEAPVDVVGCGVRTWNLFDISTLMKGYYKQFNYYPDDNYRCFSLLLPAGTYTIFAKSDILTIRLLRVSSTSLGGNGVNLDNQSYTFTLPATETIYVSLRNSTTTDDFTGLTIMLNSGSEPLPYAPYGYKLPLTVNGAEYPIYLGTVPTTRRIKKLVLDGTEDWSIVLASTNNCYFALSIISIRAIRTENEKCSHLPYKLISASNTDKGFSIIADGTQIRMRLDNASSMTLESFKQWLSDQFTAGTPVTVWYVLETEETAVVNEPLMKIGDYADTISMAQAGVTIPTVSGANVLDTTSVKPSEVYIKGRGIKPTGYGQLVDKNDVRILDKNGTRIFVHGQ